MFELISKQRNGLSHRVLSAGSLFDVVEEVDRGVGADVFIPIDDFFVGESFEDRSALALLAGGLLRGRSADVGGISTIFG